MLVHYGASQIFLDPKDLNHYPKLKSMVLALPIEKKPIINDRKTAQQLSIPQCAWHRHWRNFCIVRDRPVGLSPFPHLFWAYHPSSLAHTWLSPRDPSQSYLIHMICLLDLACWFEVSKCQGCWLDIFKRVVDLIWLDGHVLYRVPCSWPFSWCGRPPYPPGLSTHFCST